LSFSEKKSIFDLIRLKRVCDNFAKYFLQRKRAKNYGTKNMRRPRIELGSTAWKATMLTITPATLVKLLFFLYCLILDKKFRKLRIILSQNLV
jgi:hypothetical protein